MPRDMDQVVKDLRYTVRDHMTPGTPMADMMLAAADGLEDGTRVARSLGARLEQVERQIVDLQARLPIAPSTPAVQPPADAPAG